jgi:AcrR family transcriptional regulator
MTDHAHVQRWAAVIASKTRKPRTDALQNRKAILAAARQVFDAQGVLAPLDGIAMLAGVGNATLYRNFPTRDDLLAAVVESSFEDALLEGRSLSDTLRPEKALAEWMVRLAWRLRIWHDLPYCLASAHAEPSRSLNDSCRLLIEETGRLMAAAGAHAGTVEALSAEEVFELVLALSWAIDRYGDSQDEARRRVTVGTAGVLMTLEK